MRGRMKCSKSKCRDECYHRITQGQMRRWAYGVLYSHAQEVKLRDDWMAVSPHWRPQPWVTPEILVAEGILLLTSEEK